SAIGHETDTPLVDFVADLRASTPTDAAKRIVPDLDEESHRLTSARGRLRAVIAGRIAHESTWLSSTRSRPVLADPQSGLLRRHEEISAAIDRTRRAVGHRLDSANEALARTTAHLRALSPLSTLQRGYAVVQRSDDQS